MNDHSRMYWIHALTPLHVGAGRGEGYIDLPILREKVTNLPLVPGSAVKGVIADKHSATDEKRTTDPFFRAAFGISDPRGGADAGANSGSLVFTDARLVCLPVRSLYGTFAWCTSPMILRRLHRDLEAAGLANNLTVPADLTTPKTIHVANDKSVLKDASTNVFLEDLDLKAAVCPKATAWAEQLGNWLFAGNQAEDWRTTFTQRFAVVSDDVFAFLSETGTEVTARVRIDDQQKTVAKGALWYEESLPTESILAGLVWCDRVFGSKANGQSDVTESCLLNKFCPCNTDGSTLQIGGKATVGKGRVRCTFTASNAKGGKP